MITLTNAPLKPLLDRLFEQAAAAEAETISAIADISDQERTRLMQSRTDYRELYGRLKHVPLAVSRETGALLYMSTCWRAAAARGTSSSSERRSASRPCTSQQDCATMAAAG